MAINPAALKALIDTQITNETVDFAITPAEVGERMKDCIDYTTEHSTGYLVYTALISQSGSSAPTVKNLKNTTGVTFTLSRNSTGNYSLVGSSNVFTTDKTATISNFNSNGSYGNGSMFFYSIGAQFFVIETRDSGTLTDGLITDAFLEIRIYP